MVWCFHRTFLWSCFLPVQSHCGPLAPSAGQWQSQSHSGPDQQAAGLHEHDGAAAGLAFSPRPGSGQRPRAGHGHGGGLLAATRSAAQADRTAFPSPVPTPAKETGGTQVTVISAAERETVIQLFMYLWVRNCTEQSDRERFCKKRASYAALLFGKGVVTLSSFVWVDTSSFVLYSTALLMLNVEEMSVYGRIIWRGSSAFSCTAMLIS